MINWTPFLSNSHPMPCMSTPARDIPSHSITPDSSVIPAGMRIGGQTVHAPVGVLCQVLGL